MRTGRKPQSASPTHILFHNVLPCLFLALSLHPFIHPVTYAAEPIPTNSADETLPPLFTTMTIPLSLSGLTSTGTGTPKNREIMVEAVENSNPTSPSIPGFGTLNPESSPGTFLANIEFDQHLEPGIYKISVNVPKFATKQIPDSLIIAPDGTTSMSHTTQPIKLFSGDADEDGELTIFDYNLLVGCMKTLSKNTERPFCSSELSIQTDFNEDNEVNQYDYNLFLRNIRDNATLQ